MVYYPVTMEIYEIFFLAFALSLDAFSVAIGIGITAFQPRQVFRLSWHFGIFQFFMPLVGWQLGKPLSIVIGRYSHWVAFAILIIIGIKMISDSFRKVTTPSPQNATDKTRGWSLVLLSIATSIDALGAGIGLGLLEIQLLKSCLIIGVVAALMTFIGMKLGRYLSQAFGARFEALGGFVLIALAFKMLF